MALFLFGFMTKVNAVSLDYNRSGYFFEKSNGKDIYTSFYLEDYLLDGEVAYCLQLGIPEGNDYHIGSFEETNINPAIKDKLLLIAYYGYQYPNHQTKKYRAATQALIWETELGNNIKITYSTQRYGKGEKIDDSVERREILNLVEHQYDKPSFSDSSYSLKLGDKLELTDLNNALNNYEIVDANNLDVSIDNNILSINPSTKGEYEIVFRKKQAYNKPHLIYLKENYQSMITAGNVDPIYFKINVNVTGGKISINKVDSDNNINKAQGEGTLENAVYGVYNLNNKLITKLVTNKKGYAESGNVLSSGTYYIKEIKASLGYQIDKNKYYFDINQNSVSVNLTLKEKVINRDLELVKYYEDEKDNTSKLEKGITFGIYDLKDNLLKKVTTDKNGRIKLNLVYGEYVIKQLTIQDKYKKVDDFKITINENTPKTIYKTLINKLEKGSIEIIKEGEEYHFENNQYFYKDIPLDNVVYELRALDSKKNYRIVTDKKGYGYLEDIPIGKYLLKEIRSNKDNVVDSKNYEINITKDNLKIVLKMKNYIPKGDLEFQKIDSQSKKGIINTLIGIYDQDNNLIYSGYTDQDGYIKLYDLKAGSYYIKELKPNNDYEGTSEVISFEIIEGSTETVIMENDLISVWVPDTFNKVKFNISLRIIVLFTYFVYFKRKI